MRRRQYFFPMTNWKGGGGERGEKEKGRGETLFLSLLPFTSVASTREEMKKGRERQKFFLFGIISGAHQIRRGASHWYTTFTASHPCSFFSSVAGGKGKKGHFC